MGSECSDGASADEFDRELEQLIAEEVAALSEPPSNAIEDELARLAAKLRPRDDRTTLLDRLQREVLGEPDAVVAANSRPDPAPPPPVDADSEG
jgi:hypothetical protein